MPQKTWHWLAVAFMACSTAQAQEARTFYVQGGWAADQARAAVLGVTWPWDHGGWQLGSGRLYGQWDGYGGSWSSRPDDAARRNTWVLGLGPSLRWRGSAGRSPWFVEAGTSVHLSSGNYQSGSDRFSTRYNFASHMGLGRNFGAQRQHELSLRLQHTSNASLKTPNPGENFVLLRYAHAF